MNNSSGKASNARVLPPPLQKKEEDEEEAAGGKGSKGKKGGGKGIKGKLKTNQFSKDQMSVILLIVKLVLQTTQVSRDVQGILFDTFL